MLVAFLLQPEEKRRRRNSEHHSSGIPEPEPEQSLRERKRRNSVHHLKISIQGDDAEVELIKNTRYRRNRRKSGKF